MLYYSYTLMFSLFTALLLCCCVSFRSLLDGVCMSRNKRITCLLTYLPALVCKCLRHTDTQTLFCSCDLDFDPMTLI